MNLLCGLIRRGQKLARYIERPELWRLRQQGGLGESYLPIGLKWLHSLQIATVLDIGANEGQFCRIANALWPYARIYSFEPLKDCFDRLRSRMAGCTNFTAFNVGLGDERGQISFQRNAFSPSSSL